MTLLGFALDTQEVCVKCQRSHVVHTVQSHGTRPTTSIFSTNQIRAMFSSARYVIVPANVQELTTLKTDVDFLTCLTL